jgi:two-component system OmpR family sensor kinase
VTLSFRTRLTLHWLAAFGLVLAVANLAVYFSIRAFLVRDFDAQLRTLAGTELASAIDEGRMELHLHEFPIDPESSLEYTDKFVQVLDAEGQVLLQSERLTDAALLDRETLEHALAGQAPMVNVTAHGRHGRMTGLVTDGSPRYVIAVGLFTDKMDATLRRLRNLLLGVWLSALGLTASVGFVLASNALLPIRRITKKAAAIAEGDFATRLDPPLVEDEIGEMTRLLNQMLHRLHGALEANRRFAADASHELRGPLTAMQGEIDVTLMHDRTPEEYRETLTLLNGRLQVMTALTQDLMLLVRAQEQTPPAVSEVRLADLLRRVIARESSTAQSARVRIELDVPPDLLVYGEASLLERVFSNLVRNGIQYNHAHGTVTMTARLETASGEWVSDQVIVTVRNTGASIPGEERERVFERFYRLDPSRSRQTGGTGLGLAISREIIHLFKGTIRVADSIGGGTTLEVRLPGASIPHLS